MPKRHYKRCRRCHRQMVTTNKVAALQGDPPALKLSGIGEVIGSFTTPGPFKFQDFRQARRILALIWGGGGGGNSFAHRFSLSGGGSGALTYVEFDVTSVIEGVTGRVGSGGAGALAYNADPDNPSPPPHAESGQKSNMVLIYRAPGRPFRENLTFTAFGGTPELMGGEYQATGPIPPEIIHGGQNGQSGSLPGLVVQNYHSGGKGGDAPSMAGYTGGRGGAGGTFGAGRNGGQPGGGGGGGSRQNQFQFYNAGGSGGNGRVIFIRLA